MSCENLDDQTLLREELEARRRKPDLRQAWEKMQEELRMPLEGAKQTEEGRERHAQTAAAHALKKQCQELHRKQEHLDDEIQRRGLERLRT